MELLIGLSIGLFIGIAGGVAAVIVIAAAGNEFGGEHERI